ncbi:hypothetical protein ND748_13360 [Frankia sp. AiPs1]|uniref:hypothetical protein n=1 Tax=Frankia sp. AiPs1 TaxID=573493 RepID=UPI00204497BA|nr:hypothetical protein [Frankia sp. AiPs1]MCM3922643.1 hypothetical protein [Frankia sp. AiPs1]
MTIVLVAGLTIGLVLANGCLLCCLVLRLADDRRDVTDARRLERAAQYHNERIEAQDS